MLRVVFSFRPILQKLTANGFRSGNLWIAKQGLNANSVAARKQV